MVQRVNLDAMIPREDFGREDDVYEVDLIRDFPISYLASDAPIFKLLRKPDFQRETNHWSPEQISTFVASFLDNEVIPSLILWKSPTYIFVIDGGHRLSALRAWMEDDYGDRFISLKHYYTEISTDQKKVAARARRMIEERIGRFSSLRGMVGAKIESQAASRAGRLFTRTLSVQWIQGNAAVAETSFYKINSQGTPLDDTEEMLIRNRRKPIAICARAILCAGAGHKYWSAFDAEHQRKIEDLARQLFNLLFEPEVDTPLKTIDVPLGGSVSPVDALSLLVEFVTIAASRKAELKVMDKFDDDTKGDETITAMTDTLEVLRRMTGNWAGSLGLHPAVYFYNERGKYSRFLFLGMTALIAEKLRNNDPLFFKEFTRARQKVEEF